MKIDNQTKTTINMITQNQTLKTYKIKLNKMIKMNFDKITLSFNKI
jgi:hypothetical protein